MEKSCANCKFALYQDYGYSNYTVEGTEVSCLKKLHPAISFDNWYGENGQLEFGKDCHGYVHGNPVQLDVDGEESWPNDPDLDPYRPGN